MLKRFLCILLSAALVLGLIPPGTAVFAAPEETLTEFISPVIRIDKEPLGYIGIYNQSDLEAISADPHGSYILMNDITLDGTWSAICTDEHFSGVFEGNGYTISGLNIDQTVYRSNIYYLGLFGNVFGGRIANLRVCGQIAVHAVIKSGYSSSGSLFIGGVAAYVSGDANIVNCVSQVDVLFDTTSYGTQTRYDSCGGVIGEAYCVSGNMKISKCRYSGQMRSADDKSAFKLGDVGGIIGTVNGRNGTILVESCHNMSDLDNKSYLGGIVGQAESYGSAGDVLIWGCWNQGYLQNGFNTGGIVGRTYMNNSGFVRISDCLNTGEIRAVDTIPFGGGIAARAEAYISRCVNTGYVNTGCAIAGSINSEDNINDCYFLNDMGTSFRWLNGSLGPSYTNTDGQITPEAMAKQDTFQELTFDRDWIMAQGYAHPCPTALIRIDPENAYKEQYIINASTMMEDSDYFVSIAGHGEGGLAGSLGTAFRSAHRDHVNGVWSSMEFIENLLKAQVNLSGHHNKYYILMSDLIAGSLGQEDYENCLRDAVLAAYSDIITYLTPLMDAQQALECKDALAALADMSKSDSEIQQLLGTIMGNVGKVADWDAVGEAFTALGSLVSLVEAEAAFCKNYSDLINFYSICNGYVHSVENYCKILTDTAEKCDTLSTEDHEKIMEAVEDLTDDMILMAKDDPTLLNRRLGGGIADLLLAGGAAVMEIKVQMVNFNYVLAGIRAGVALGMPLADSLTNMDSITYYGTMLSMAGNLAEGMHYTVMEYQEIFRHDPTYENAQMLESSLQLYLHLQLQAVDYAIGYYDAVASATLATVFRGNRDEIVEIYGLLVQKYKLETLIESGHRPYISQDGSIVGFVAACRVQVTVTGPDGTSAQLGTGSISYDPTFEGMFTLTGENQERKAGRFDPSRYSLTFTGEDDGAMNLLLYSVKSGIAAQVCAYQKVSVSESVSLNASPDGLFRSDGTLVIPDETTYLNLGFRDIPEGKYYTQPALWAYYEGITTGTGDGTTFSPDNPCTRKQIVTFLWRAAGEPEPASMENPFTDVKHDRFEKAILWAYYEGITKGTSATEFSPEKPCTRKQIVTFLWRWAGQPNPASDKNPFTDVKNDQFRNAILWAYYEGITTGKTATTFLPEDVCIRGQIVTFLYRAMVE